MKKSFSIIFITVFATLLLSACGFNMGAKNNETVIATNIAMTVSAMNALQPTQTAIPVQPTNTLPPVATITAQPTATPQSCNEVMFISENPLDGAEFDPGETFTKRWRFKNTGTCTWNTNYKVVYYSGDDIEGAATTKLANSTAPGEVLDIVYDFKAPAEGGTYYTLFKLQDDKGVNFAQFWVQFKVKSEDFAVTNVTLSTEHAIITGSCPQTFDYQAVIKTNNAGTVTYYLSFSDGNTSSTKSLTFSEAGSKTISGSWELNASGDYWIKLYIDEPNHQMFGPLNLSLTCY
ncbi:MAG TPA: hypothetical protein DCK95_09585 [Anaerolineaceae bacterium]|uniref:Nbr1 FW domain-containing protein n=1 Tax=Anaerolinea thermophila TaxID=167964 RepID=A0A101FXZ3_9CHLR|nr:MAG: hypothetical protein XD73_0706 [Anaerolinea thermophila]HAF62561.1 hypothetical protein [Anaerolineaceae bacterium]